MAQIYGPLGVCCLLSIIQVAVLQTRGLIWTKVVADPGSFILETLKPSIGYPALAVLQIAVQDAW